MYIAEYYIVLTLSKIPEELKEVILVGFGDVIDRISCTPVGSSPIGRKGRNGPFKNRYAWINVYDDTRKRFGRPLTLLAAEKIKENVGEGDYVFILTNSGEMDGPPGAAALARALIIGLKAVPVILTSYEKNTNSEKCLPQTCIGAEIIPVTNPNQLYEGNQSPNTVLILNWPAKSVAGAIEESKKILDEFKPKAVITVEAVSHNKKGVRHGSYGDTRKTSGNPEEEDVRWNQLLDVANERKILTIATGDNGNEAGFGTIEDILKKHHKFCADCGCPCGGGIVSASKADIVIPGQSSNWAAYGIEACLAKILDKLEVMHDEDTEKRILLNCSNAGIPDGSTARVTPTTDGSSHKSGIYTVGQLRETIKMSSMIVVREPRPRLGK